MSLNSTIEDIEDEISSWGYSISLSDYEHSIQIEESMQMKTKASAGRGISACNGMDTVRLASEIHNLKAKAIPMGHLATTSELLDSPSENEITPLLRQLGISSQDDKISSKTTRQNATTDELRIDGHIPVILNGDLFNIPGKNDSQTTYSEDDEPFDPSRPLHEQFKTIKEFCQVVTTNENVPVTKEICRKEIADDSSSLTTYDEKIGEDSSTDITTTTSESSALKSSTSIGDSSEQLLRPLLNQYEKLYTPKELYFIKRQPLKKYSETVTNENGVSITINNNNDQLSNRNLKQYLKDSKTIAARETR